MSPALNGSSALQRFEHSNAIEIRNGIMFDFYLGLPHMSNSLYMYLYANWTNLLVTKKIKVVNAVYPWSGVTW